MSIIWTIAEQALRQQMNGVNAPSISAVHGPRFSLFAAAGLLAVAGMGFTLAATYMALLTVTVPSLAALGTAGAAFAAGGLMIGIAELMRTIRRRRVKVYEQDNMAAINDAVQMIVEELEEPVKAYPKTAMALAALAGLMAGGRIH